MVALCHNLQIGCYVCAVQANMPAIGTVYFCLTRVAFMFDNFDHSHTVFMFPCGLGSGVQNTVRLRLANHVTNTVSYGWITTISFSLGTASSAPPAHHYSSYQDRDNTVPLRWNLRNGPMRSFLTLQTRCDKKNLPRWWILGRKFVSDISSRVSREVINLPN